VPVFNAPGANANAVKELVLAALLLAARNIVPALRFVAALDPDAQDLDRHVEEGKKQFAGVELPYRTCSVSSVSVRSARSLPTPLSGSE
jgi:D-3-phosphoglycerate dehydrogenase / 2-oxoglutarate reductase